MRVRLWADDHKPSSAYIQHVSARARFMGEVRSVDPRLVDGVLAFGLTVWALLEPGALQDPARAFVLVAMTVAIAWRRRSPLAVLIVEVAGLVLLPSQLNWPQGAALLIAAYSAALYSDRRVVAFALLVAAGVWFLKFGSRVQVPRGFVPFALLAPAWLAGVAMRNRERRAQALAARAERLEVERDAALRAERARIARELHDVVTHSVSVMVLQTGAARQIMAQDEHRADALLDSVETSGRSALEELRRLLGVLSDGDGQAPRSPQPGVSEIPALVEQVHQAGLPVELRVEGEPRIVSGGATIAAYRIVQEALTNVLKHAAGAPTTVILRWEDAALELEILDRGTALQTPDDAPAGRGLAGMRERARMYGGSVDAGPEPGRGYVVRARIPVGSRGA
jgi:signal transduction histidine kinase